MAFSSAVAVPVLAFATTIHAIFVLLRRHRSASVRGGLLLLLPAIAFAFTPWAFPTLGGLAIGFAVQLAWFVACEKLAHEKRTGPVGSKMATGPLPPRRAADLARPPTPGAARTDNDFMPVPVLAVHHETETIRTFRLARPAHFAFSPGQFLTVKLAIDGRPAVRCYSISSAPQTTGYMEISVRRIGLVSSALHDLVRPGSTLLVKPPAGKFVYPSQDSRPLVLMAGGVGITPVLSMLRHAVAVEPMRPVTLLYSVRSDTDIAFRDELAVIGERHPQVQIAITVAERSGRGDWRIGHIDDSLVRRLVSHPAGALYYVCGPGPMMDAMRAMLVGLGVPEAQVRNEVFQPSAAIGAREAAPGSQPSNGLLTAATLTCAVSHRAVPLPPASTLLEAAETSGIQIPSLCRAGVCGTCRTRLLSGDVRCTSDALSDEDRANNYVLPCVSWSEGDCVLEV